MQVGHKRQNESADLMAGEGYDVTMLPEVDGGYGRVIDKNPDFVNRSKNGDLKELQELIVIRNRRIFKW